MAVTARKEDGDKGRRYKYYLFTFWSICPSNNTGVAKGFCTLQEISIFNLPHTDPLLARKDGINQRPSIASTRF